MPNRNDPLQEELDTFQSNFLNLERELSKVIVGNQEIIRSVLTAIFAGGHVLLEGVPGLGKTLLVRSIAHVLGLSFKRIQFTPDLMPSDITGLQILVEDNEGNKSFDFKRGPLFANLVLADEINRTTPKTQSALLEAMEERQVTIFDRTHRLPNPFFVLATQNPLELEGTYPLPEAQLDRFLLKVSVLPPPPEELKEILIRTTGVNLPQLSQVFQEEESANIILSMRNTVRRVVVADVLLLGIVKILGALTPSGRHAPKKVVTYVRFGPGPRGAQSVLLAAKVMALLDGRINLSFQDIRKVLLQALAHRLILNYQSVADGVSANDIIDEVSNLK
jgi:MoxR-like ATPase